MNFNPLHFMWISYSFIVTFSGLNVIYFHHKIPRIFVRMFTFGKARKGFNQRSFVQWFEVPKRWFSHFYVFASVYFAYISFVIYQKYFLHNPTTPTITFLLDRFSTPIRTATVNPESVVIISILITLQAFRRCYECLFVSVYSDCKMNILHYIVGITFYFGIGLSILNEAPGFDNTNMKITFSNQWLIWNHVLGVLFFSFGFLLQFHTHKAFASFRKDKKGEKIISLEHHIPSGGFFEYLSCPHYFAEIVIYMAANLIFGGSNTTWWLACLWTVSNQIITGLMSHHWYKNKFKHYPLQRKAVIPFLL